MKDVRREKQERSEWDKKRGRRGGSGMMGYLWALHLVVRVCNGTVVVSVAVPIVSVVIGRTAGSTWGQETITDVEL